MIPTANDYLQGEHIWSETHKSTPYEVKHHGITPYTYAGIWCFYVTFREEFFQRPEDWAKFDLKQEIKSFGPASYAPIDYNSLPELPWHCGPTFGERADYVNRRGKLVGAVKIGCDYSHLYDRERGYPDTLETVKNDAKRLIDVFHRNFPQKLACAYDGTIDIPENFRLLHGQGLPVHVKNTGQYTKASEKDWLAFTD